MLRFSTVHSWAPIFCVSTLENIIQISCWAVPGTLPSLKSLFPRLPLSPEFCHSDFDFCLRPVGAIRKIAGRMISKATSSSRVRDTEIFTHEKNKTCNKPFCLGGIQRSTHYLVCSKSMHKYDDVIKGMSLCEGNQPVTGGFRSQRPVTRSFDVSLTCA